MRRLTCKIILGKFEFDFVKSVKVESSWRNLTDTATIELPRKIKWKDRFLKDEIKRGDGVEIWLGHDFENKKVFQGNVSEVGAEVPVAIRCEDEMWQLKQKTVTKAWASATLKEVLADILPEGMPFEAIDADLGPVRISQATVSKALGDLRRIYGLYPFFRDGVLLVGFPYSLTDASEHTFTFQKDIVDDNLKYQRADDVKLKVKGISIKPNGQKLTIEKGDADGAQRTLHYFDLTFEQLKKNVEEDLQLLRYDGFTGSFQTFVSPFVRPGDVAVLNGGEYPEKTGKYFIDEVLIRFGEAGSTYQNLRLGKRAG